MDITLQGSSIALKNNIPCACDGMSCKDCDFLGDKIEPCKNLRIRWFETEYEEPMVKVIHAKWVECKYNDGYIGYNFYYCSNCHWDGNMKASPTFNYCPNCGAKMDLKEEK